MKNVCIFVKLILAVLFTSCSEPVLEIDDYTQEILNSNKPKVTKITKISASDGPISSFGCSVALSSGGNTIVVGALGDTTNAFLSGAIYIYKKNGSSWEETKIIASDGAFLDEFGNSVAISSDGETIVVGAHDHGYAYIYKWNGSDWDETKITPHGGPTTYEFGKSVAISSDGNTVVVGESEAYAPYANTGIIYIYRWNGSSWGETNIKPSDGLGNLNFGNSVAISSDGNRVVVGHNDDDWYNSSFYIYNWNGSSWSETKKIISVGGSGRSIDISSDGNTIVVSGLSEDIGGEKYGCMYIYNWNGSIWIENSLVQFPKPEVYSTAYGSTVSASSNGNVLITGKPNYNLTGLLYLYYKYDNQWIEVQIKPDDRFSYDEFGSPTEISEDGKTIVVGNVDSTSVYIFNIEY